MSLAVRMTAVYLSRVVCSSFGFKNNMQIVKKCSIGSVLLAAFSVTIMAHFCTCEKMNVTVFVPMFWPCVCMSLCGGRGVMMVVRWSSGQRFWPTRE